MTDSPRLSWPARLAAASVRFRFAVLGVLATLARLMPLTVYASNVITRLGLGIDYALFVVARVREEARAGLGLLDHR